MRRRLRVQFIVSGQDTTFTCTPGGGHNCDLHPNTICQIVFEVVPSNCSNNCRQALEMTNSGVETNSPSNAGWTIGNEISVMQTGYPWVRVQRDQDDLKHLGAIAAYMLVGVAGIMYKLLNTGTPREPKRSTW